MINVFGNRDRMQREIDGMLDREERARERRKKKEEQQAASLREQNMKWSKPRGLSRKACLTSSNCSSRSALDSVTAASISEDITEGAFVLSGCASHGPVEAAAAEEAYDINCLFASGGPEAFCAPMATAVPPNDAGQQTSKKKKHPLDKLHMTIDTPSLDSLIM